MNKKIFFIILTFLFLPTAFVLGQELSLIISNIRTQLVLIGGIIVTIGWVVAGIMYLTAAGGERMATAKKALIACVIGTVLIVLAEGADRMLVIMRNLLNLNP